MRTDCLRRGYIDIKANDMYIGMGWHIRNAVSDVGSQHTSYKRIQDTFITVLYHTLKVNFIVSCEIRLFKLFFVNLYGMITKALLSFIRLYDICYYVFKSPV